MRRVLLLVLFFACSPAPPAPPPGGIDLHLHCFPTTTCDGVPCCDLSRWNAAMGDRSDVGGVLLSLQHFSVLQKLGGLPEAQAFIPRQNETVRLHATKTPTVAWFSSLPCWSEERWGPTWLTRCQADVDAQLGLGARGFKDHTGKTYAHNAAQGDALHWLGAWNRLNGACSSVTADANPNGQCLSTMGARFPGFEPDYQALVKYVVETKKAVWLTHMRDWSGAPETCFDPTTQSVRSCADVTKGQLLAFAAWAKASLSREAARRIVIAHLGFFTNDTEALTALLDAGLTLDTAAAIKDLSTAGCRARALMAKYPDQLVWGSDADIGAACLPATMASWNHLFTGKLGDERTFRDTCSGTVALRGLDLKSPTVSACKGQGDVPADLYDRVVHTNAARLLGL